MGFSLDTEDEYRNFVSDLNSDLNGEKRVRVKKPEDLDLTGAYSRIPAVGDFVIQIVENGGCLGYINNPNNFLHMIGSTQEDVDFASYEVREEDLPYIKSEFSSIIKETVEEEDLTEFQTNIKECIENELDGEDDCVSFYSSGVAVNGIGVKVEWINGGDDVDDNLFDHMSDDEYNDENIPKYRKAADMILWYNMIERNK